MPKITGCGILPLDQRGGRVLIHPRVYGFTDLLRRAGDTPVMVHAFDVYPQADGSIALGHVQPPRPPNERVVVESMEDAQALMAAMTS